MLGKFWVSGNIGKMRKAILDICGRISVDEAQVKRR
jgi:hypothetical protein